MAGSTESPLSITLKPHDGFTAPLITIRADNPDELEQRLEGVKDHFELIAETQGVLVAAFGLRSESAQQPAQQQSSGGGWGSSGGGQQRQNNGGGRGFGGRGGGGGRGGDQPASPKQRELIAKLADERVTDGITLPDPNSVTKAQASAAIDALMAAPEKSSGKAWG